MRNKENESRSSRLRQQQRDDDGDANADEEVGPSFPLSFSEGSEDLSQCLCLSGEAGEGCGEARNGRRFVETDS